MPLCIIEVAASYERMLKKESFSLREEFYKKRPEAIVSKVVSHDVRFAVLGLNFTPYPVSSIIIPLLGAPKRAPYENIRPLSKTQNEGRVS
jgi:hypothetical protein